MARKLFEKQGIRTRAGALATGTEFVVYTDSAGTALADISATSGGSAIAGSTVTVTDLPGLGLATLRFYGPTDDTDTLYLRCPADPSLGVQEVEADEDERLDALEAGGGGGVTDHGALTGLSDDDHPQYATDTDLSTHAADTTAIHGIADTSALATTSGVTSAVSTHAGLTDPHTGYVLESLYDAKGDLLAASADNTPAKVTAGANDTVLVADSAQTAGVKWAAVPSHAEGGTFFLPVSVTPQAQTNWNALTSNADNPANARLISGGNQNDEINWYIQLAAGTWTLDLWHNEFNNRGIYTIQLDGATVGTLDGYDAAGPTAVKESVTGLTVATSGVKLFKLKMATKNASSSGFYGDIFGLAWVKTA